MLLYWPRGSIFYFKLRIRAAANGSFDSRFIIHWNNRLITQFLLASYLAASLIFFSRHVLTNNKSKKHKWFIQKICILINFAAD